MATNFAPKREYLDCTDIARRIRTELKKAFPGTKFSVRSSRYAGGSSVAVRYEDGPLAKEVEAYANRYAYKHFDGMDDSTHYSADLILREGELVEQSGGSYIFVSRDWTDPTRDAIIADIAHRYGIPVPSQRENPRVILDGSSAAEAKGGGRYCDGTDYVWDMARSKFHRTEYPSGREACHYHHKLNCDDCAIHCA